jgi:hypothetical protein
MFHWLIMLTLRVRLEVETHVSQTIPPSGLGRQNRDEMASPQFTDGFPFGLIGRVLEETVENG